MRIIRHWEGLEPGQQGASVAVGNFDGVHRGHLKVIDIARKAATSSGAPLGILTFEPHPREYFAPDAPPFRLMNTETRANRLAKLGVELLYELPFGKEMSSLPAEGFAGDVLSKGMKVSHVVIGADFCFGKGRQGNAQSLREFGARMGFGVTVANLLAGDGGRVSSTAIRDALCDGRPGDAAAMLGHWHRIDGEVFHGAKRGREMGYPTANMSVAGLHLPRLGIYAVLVDVLTGPHAGHYQGAASLGVRPMFGENQPNLETYLFDFKGDLYGEHLSVALVEFLRPEGKFTDLAALVAQMDADCARARAILATL